MSRRVVVTGMGAITPIGLSVEEFWQSIKEGKIGFGEITKFDTEGYKCHLANAEVKDFDAKQYMDAKNGKTYGTVLPVCSGKKKRLHRRRSETVLEVSGELSVSIKDCWKKDRPK